MWPRAVRASPLERTCVLPGEELIPEPIGTLTHALGIPFIRVGHFIMQRRQLLGIAQRAESRPATETNTKRSEAT